MLVADLRRRAPSVLTSSLPHFLDDLRSAQCVRPEAAEGFFFFLPVAELELCETVERDCAWVREFGMGELRASSGGS